MSIEPNINPNANQPMKTLTQRAIDNLESSFGLQPGESYLGETCYTRNRATRYKGHSIESFYDENACNWNAFVKGIGTSTAFDDELEAIDLAKERIDSRT